MRLSILSKSDQIFIFSAVKKDGVRLYEHARAGESIEIASRKTTIQWKKYPNCFFEIDFRVVCSKEHIRSLAYDFEPCNGSH
jgi:tRNA pseudouridine55 synthase